MATDTATEEIERFYAAQNPDEQIAKRNDTLRAFKMPPATIRKAWFTMAHLLLNDGSAVLHMGCGEGDLTFTMALLNPHLHFTGIDKNKRKIARANARFELDNLDYKVGDLGSKAAGAESVDAIIDSYVLHEVYSSSRYDEEAVSNTLKTHHQLLKKGGQLFVQDYVRPPPEEMILIEMPDHPSKGDNIQDMSEADLLVWYAQHARPKHDPGCGGFFLEELPPHFPKTRLFRLPHKWAYEFIMRKDERAAWETELPMQYTFFTKRELRKTLSHLGMRTFYAAPYFDDDIIKTRFEGKFRLYSDDGTPLGDPPVGYIAVSTKLAERKSLEISERRPSSKKEDSKISVQTMRNNKTGALMEMARRNIETSEILPYRIAENGRLKIYLQNGIVRGITQAIPRKGNIVDDKRWSGHMVEAIAVENKHLPETLADTDFKTTVTFAADYLGLKPANGASFEKGPDTYPAPDYIDEHIKSYFLPVTPQTRGKITPKKASLTAERFQAKGETQEFDAQQILDAITVGMIPNSRLELQILALFARLKRKPENWTKKDILFQAGEALKNTSLRGHIKNLGLEHSLFKDVKGSTGQLRPMQSVFVEEGQSRGTITGLSFEDISFVIKNEETHNIATVLPLTKDEKGMVQAGFLIDQMPVPQRHQGNGLTISAPVFTLPPEATNQRLIKKFLAKKMGVLPDNIIKMGEPYFTHSGLTPQRVHPYAVSVPHAKLDDPTSIFLPMYQLMLMSMNKKFMKSGHFMTLIGRSFRYMSDELRYDAKITSRYIATADFSAKPPEITIPLDYHRAPSLPDAPRETTPHQQPLIAKKPAAEKAVPAAKAVTLKENIPPQFTATKMPEAAAITQQSQTISRTINLNDRVQQAVKATQQMLMPLTQKPNPENAPDMGGEFDKEMEAFDQELKAIPDLKDDKNQPRPEKW